MSGRSSISQRAGRALALAMAAVLTGCGGAEPEPPARLAPMLNIVPPMPGANLIIVSFDSMRPDALGVYGAQATVSPRIDAFAARAVVFDRAYSIAPVTPTSFAGAWTGLLPTRSFQRWKLVGGPTLAERLRDLGYATLAVVNNVQLDPSRGFDRGFDQYAWHRNAPDEDVAERGLQLLAELDTRPFLFWLHLLKPHAPYRYREQSAHLYDDGYSGRFQLTTGGQFEAEEPREIDRIRSLYDGEIFHADSIFGQLIDEFERRGLLETSFVVLTSDHGEEFGEHGGFQHGQLYQEHLRIPLIVRHPRAAGGLRSDLLIRNLDLAPTFLGWVGQPPTDRLDGLDLTSATQEPEELIAVQMTTATDRSVSIQVDQSKLIVDCGQKTSLRFYDLVTDPHELTDLSSSRPEQVRRLGRRLIERLGGAPCPAMDLATAGTSATEGLDAESIEALRALGYLGE